MLHSLKTLGILAIILAAVAGPAFATNPTGTADQVLRIPGAGGLGKYGQVDLSKTAATKNQLLASRGGTGQDFSGSTGFIYDTAGTFSSKSNTQATALLDVFVGDSGSGGTKGLVPAPGAGDAAASKFLKADGTFAVPSTVVAPGSITATEMSTNVNLPGTTVSAGGLNVITSSTNAATGLKVIRGNVSSAGSITAGEGFTVSSHPSTGNYVLAFTSAFASLPTVTVSPENPNCAGWSALSTSGVTIITGGSGCSGVANNNFMFTAIGPR